MTVREKIRGWSQGASRVASARPAAAASGGFWTTEADLRFWRPNARDPVLRLLRARLLCPPVGRGAGGCEVHSVKAPTPFVGAPPS